MTKKNVLLVLVFAISSADESLVTAERRRDILRRLNCASYEDHKIRNPKAVDNTCLWFTEHQTFRRWMAGLETKFLWVSADPGCGKSVLARRLIDHELKPHKVIYFFFKDGYGDQDNAESALACLLHQFLEVTPNLFTDQVVESLEELGPKRIGGFSDLWKVFTEAIHGHNISSTIFVLDALDECESAGWSKMAGAIGELVKNGEQGPKFLVFSRPHNQIRRVIREAQISHIEIRGENVAENGGLSEEINIVICERVNDLVNSSIIRREERKKVIMALQKWPNRSYLGSRQCTTCSKTGIGLIAV